MEAAPTRSRLARRAWRLAAVAPVGHPRTAGDDHKSLGWSSWTPQPGYHAWASFDPQTVEIATASEKNEKKNEIIYFFYVIEIKFPIIHVYHLHHLSIPLYITGESFGGIQLILTVRSFHISPFPTVVCGDMVHRKITLIITLLFSYIHCCPIVISMIATVHVITSMSSPDVSRLDMSQMINIDRLRMETYWPD
jgi:hypothetical protein